MYEQLTLLDTVKSTSSPGSEVGALPSDLLGSLTTSRCGQAPHPVSPSATQASSAEQTTSGIYGRSCAISSLSASLQSSLENRLRVALASTGSPLYALTWKERAMRSGPPIYALRASARRTFDRGFTGEASGWPTPIVNDETGSQYFGSNGRQYLKVPGAAALTGWPTPVVSDKTGSQYFGSQRLKVPGAAALTGWPTPDASEAKTGYQRRDTGMAGTQKNLGTVTIDCLGDRPHLLVHGPARMTANGELLTGSSAGTSGGVRLNPAHSRWLMGFPREWDDCAATATPLSRKSQRRS